MSDNLLWIWLSQACWYENGNIDVLLREFGTPRRIYEATKPELEQHIGDNGMEVLRLMNKDLSEAQRIMNACFRLDIGILVLDDPKYPAHLRMIQNPPPVLYYKGQLPVFDGNLIVTVVGTRRMSQYGKKMAFELSFDMARAGAVIVTGMALGIDGVASAAAVAAGGTTVAILGSGLDIIYPPEHQCLMESIINRGVVMSEFPPGTRPLAENFPQRNRIMSGIAQSVVVIEGNSRSGALITARLATKQGRDVYALPGNADEENSEATTVLLKNGAKLITCADDVIHTYESVYKQVSTLHLLEKVHVEPDRVLRDLGVSARFYKPIPSTFAHNERTNGAAVGGHRPRNERDVGRKLQNPPVKRETPTGENLQNIPLAEHGQMQRIEKILDSKTLAIYKRMPLGKSVTIDELCDEECTTSDIITAMSTLQIYKCVIAFPGGRYIRS